MLALAGVQLIFFIIPSMGLCQMKAEQGRAESVSTFCGTECNLFSLDHNSANVWDCISVFGAEFASNSTT